MFIKKHQKKPEQLQKKLHHLCQAGFGAYERLGKFIRSEGDGAYRVAVDDSIFRIWGYYEDDTRKNSFVAVLATFSKDPRGGRGPDGDAAVTVIKRIKNGQISVVKQDPGGSPPPEAA